MSYMGRKRKTNDGLEQRVYYSHGNFFYCHPAPPGGKARWENLGEDMEVANRKAKVYNEPSTLAGSMVYWFEEFLRDCGKRVEAGTLSQRTLDDYTDAIGTQEAPGSLRIYLCPPDRPALTPYDITADVVQAYLEIGNRAKRARRANLERAALSSCFGWLLRTPKHCPGLVINPCLKGSGVKRNLETVRERYVTDEEYAAVWTFAPRQVRLMMAMTYRTLQRPESDIILWDTRVVVTRPTGRTLEFEQNKTKQRMVIAFTPELDELLPRRAPSVVRPLHREPIVKKLDGGFYTYDGLSAMLKRAIAKASEVRVKARLEPIASFGFRDLKGKGATDMWLAKVPIEQIQALCGHSSKTTTERYVKARWRESVQPNTVQMA